MNKKMKQSITALAVLFVLCGGCCTSTLLFFGKHISFSNPKTSLDEHLQHDFGMTLPAFTTVPQGYWVVVRDPEHVYEVQIAPADITPWIDRLKIAAAARQDDVNAFDSPARVHPLYGAPPWWNSPPLPDADSFKISIKDKGITTNDYGIIWSGKTGKAYIFWGGF